MTELPAAVLEGSLEYQKGFLQGMGSARFSLIKRGWTSDDPMSVADAVAIIDAERETCIRLFTRMDNGETKESK